MENQELVQFHSSAESLAGEIVFRKALRKAGFSEREIDGMLLRAFLRKRLFADWAAVTAFVLCAVPFVVRPMWGIRIPALTLVVTLAVAISAAWVIASYRSLVLAKSPERWVRKKGPTWTGIWERR